jgi:hypothetical protein
MTTTLSLLPTRMDIEIQRGNDVDIAFEPTREEAPVAGLGEYAWELAIRWRGGSILKSSEPGDGIAVRDGLVTCSLREAETRRVPQGATARYELFARDSARLQRTWLSGVFSANGGLNHD